MNMSTTLQLGALKAIQKGFELLLASDTMPEEPMNDLLQLMRKVVLVQVQYTGEP